MTSIGFGGNEVVQVSLPLGEVAALVQKALSKRRLLEFEDATGETLVINPQQIRVLQDSGEQGG